MSEGFEPFYLKDASLSDADTIWDVELWKKVHTENGTVRERRMTLQASQSACGPFAYRKVRRERCVFKVGLRYTATEMIEIDETWVNVLVWVRMVPLLHGEHVPFWLEHVTFWLMPSRWSVAKESKQCGELKYVHGMNQRDWEQEMSLAIERFVRRI